jgi:hypothetical protein
LRVSWTLAVCLGGLFCTRAFCDAPDIYFTNVPAYGTYDMLSGRDQIIFPIVSTIWVGGNGFDFIVIGILYERTS